MSDALWLTGFCFLVLLGAALPLLRKRRLPPPPEGGWKSWDDTDPGAPHGSGQ